MTRIFLRPDHVQISDIVSLDVHEARISRISNRAGVAKPTIVLIRTFPLLLDSRFGQEYNSLRGGQIA